MTIYEVNIQGNGTVNVPIQGEYSNFFFISERGTATAGNITANPIRHGFSASSTASGSAVADLASSGQQDTAVGGTGLIKSFDLVTTNANGSAKVVIHCLS